MDTVNHLNEHQLREELSRSQNTLAELQTNHATLQAEMDKINTGLCSFMTVLYGSPLPIASHVLKDAVREMVQEQIKNITVDLSSCTLEGDVQTYISDSFIGGDPTIILREES
jgi:hypothetical protein